MRTVFSHTQASQPSVIFGNEVFPKPRVQSEIRFPNSKEGMHQPFLYADDMRNLFTQKAQKDPQWLHRRGLDIDPKDNNILHRIKTGESYCLDDSIDLKRLYEDFIVIKGGSTSSLDYYAILGVPQSADAETIKKAYRRLARKYHPDAAGRGKPEAEEQFKKVNEAYEVLGDKEARKKYDQHVNQPHQEAHTDGERKENKTQGIDYREEVFRAIRVHGNPHDFVLVEVGEFIGWWYSEKGKGYVNPNTKEGAEQLISDITGKPFQFKVYSSHYQRQERNGSGDSQTRNPKDPRPHNHEASNQSQQPLDFETPWMIQVARVFPTSPNKLGVQTRLREVPMEDGRKEKVVIVRIQSKDTIVDLPYFATEMADYGGFSRKLTALSYFLAGSQYPKDFIEAVQKLVLQIEEKYRKGTLRWPSES